MQGDERISNWGAHEAQQNACSHSCLTGQAGKAQPIRAAGRLLWDNSKYSFLYGSGVLISKSHIISDPWTLLASLPRVTLPSTNDIIKQTTAKAKPTKKQLQQ